MAVNKVIPKKRGRPATGRDPVTAIRLPADLKGALDKWIEQQPEPKPSRSEAIREAVKDWLTGMGLLNR